MLTEKLICLCSFFCRLIAFRTFMIFFCVKWVFELWELLFYFFCLSLLFFVMNVCNLLKDLCLLGFDWVDGIAFKLSFMELMGFIFVRFFVQLILIWKLLYNFQHINAANSKRDLEPFIFKTEKLFFPIYFNCCWKFSPLCCHWIINTLIQIQLKFLQVLGCHRESE